MWAGIVALTFVVTLLAESIPAFVVQVLWPTAVLLPAFSAYSRARHQDWTGRSRRAAVVNAVVAVIVAAAMLSLTLGRSVDDPVERFRLNAALLLTIAQPSWFVWSLYDSFMLFLRQRRP